MEEQKQKPEIHNNANQAPPTEVFTLGSGAGAPSKNPQGSVLEKLIGSNQAAGVASSQDAAKNGNVFTRLFGKPKTPSVTAPVKQSVLGPRPMLSVTSTFSREVDKRKSQKAARVLMIVVLLVFLSAGYFTLMLNPTFTLFGKNVSTTFVEGVQELKKVQINFNESNLRIAQLHLDRIIQLGDSFRHHYAISQTGDRSAQNKAASEAELVRLRSEIKASAGAVKDAFSKSFAMSIDQSLGFTLAVSESDFITATQEVFQKQKNDLSNVNDPAVILESRRVESILRILSDESFRQYFANLSVDDMKDADVIATLDSIEEKGADDLSVIGRLKKNRIRWTQVIADIEHITRQVDTLFGQGLYDEIGGIEYTGYDFDKDSGRVSITGVTKTEDSRTFSLIANLIDRFEKSPQFKDVDMRSFSKSESENGGFASSIRLSFSLQTETDQRDDLLINPTAQP